MRVLYDSGKVQETIKGIFKTSKGQRIAITAFVGDKAIAYLPNPEGIKLVCWPKAGGTNPNSVRDLMRRGVEAYFASNLHMKLYWTEDKGAVLTSANLSISALGSGGLKEIGIYLDSGEIDIARIWRTIQPRPVSNALLDKLEMAHRDYFKRNPLNKLRLPKKTNFLAWYSMRLRPRWKYAWAEERDVKLSERSKALLKREHGSTDYELILQAAKGDYNVNDWVLYFSSKEDSVKQIAWTYAHHVIEVSTKELSNHDKELPVQVIQVFPLSTLSFAPPFHIDKEFRDAFRKAFCEYGGDKKFGELTSTHMTNKFIELISRNMKK